MANPIPLILGGENCGCLINGVPLQIRGFSIRDAARTYKTATSLSGGVEYTIPTIKSQGGSLAVEWDFAHNPTLSGAGYCNLKAGNILVNMFLFPNQTSQGTYDGAYWSFPSIVITGLSAATAIAGGANVTTVAFDVSGGTVGQLVYPST